MTGVTSNIQVVMEQKASVYAVLVAGTAALSAYIYWTRKSKTPSVKSRLLSREELQKVKWEHVGKLRKVWIYPVKSCAGISLQTAQAWPLGLMDGKVRDRAFAFATEKGNMIRGSMIGATVQINVELKNNTLILKHDTMEDLSIELDQVDDSRNESTVNIFGEVIPGLDCGDDVANWLEKVFKKKARLLYHSNIPSPRRTDDLIDQYPLMKANDNSLYADKFPYLLMTKESVDDLQSKVTSCPTPPENFRPNLFVEGTPKAYDEDDWAYIKIGDAIFRNLSPCARCTFTTVNYKTGIKDPNTEPLKTLKSYRCIGDEKDPSFGINLGLEVLGSVNENDDVYVTRLSKM